MHLKRQELACFEKVLKPGIFSGSCNTSGMLDKQTMKLLGPFPLLIPRASPSMTFCFQAGYAYVFFASGCFDYAGGEDVRGGPTSLVLA